MAADLEETYQLILGTRSCIILFGSLLLNLLHRHFHAKKYPKRPDSTLHFKPRPRFAKVTVITEIEDVTFERGLQAHLRHAEKYAYPIHVGRQVAVPGIYNKIAYILSILLNELNKPPEERVEWLFYFDADTIIMNQKLPLDIFEPPSDFNHINFIASKDPSGFNAGVFFLRVNSWSCNLLARVLTYKHYHPDEDYQFEEQTILARLIEKDPKFMGQLYLCPESMVQSLLL